ncbi:MAG: CoA-binding protein, partial [Ignavibacteriaceae bacterium]|nr:CoA-binding protein [Ignavibacteriaceae bacterium]
MNSKKIVEDFLAQKKIAIVGVSRTKTKFGNTIYKELKQKNYDVYAVNPYITTFDDDPCYVDLQSI